MKRAWIFPGQGAQKVGMGRELFEHSKMARQVFERADAALGFSLSKLCFEGPDSELGLTQNTQPAIVATSIAALEAYREADPTAPIADYVAGHSLGEYSALVAAGALSLEDAVRLVRLRGKAMQEAVPAGEGKMAAIMGGDVAAVEALCKDAAQGQTLSAANYNAPGQIVIAGATAAIERAAVLAKERSLKAIVLKVSAPFHCAMMAPAKRRLEQALAEVSIADPKICVVANVSAEENTQGDQVADLLVRQVDSAVLWEQSVRHMVAAGIDDALEFGPGKVLAGLAKRIDKSLCVQSLGMPQDISRVVDPTP